MFEKDMRLVVLLDCYGELLGEHRRSIMELYYCEDFSLAEIAENTGISRQAVRESIKKSETELHAFEEKLHLAERLPALRAYCADAAARIERAAVLVPNENDRAALRDTAAFLRAAPL